MSAIFFPQILRIEQKKNRLNICTNHLHQSEADENFTKLFITGTETCLLRCQNAKALFTMETRIITKTGKSKTELIKRIDHSVVLTVEILCTMSSFLRVPDCFTASTKDSAQPTTGTLVETQMVYSPQPSCTNGALHAEVSCKKHNSNNSTSTLQL